MEFLRKFYIWPIALLSLAGYCFIAYDILRIDHIELFGSFSLLFLLFVAMVFHFAPKQKPWLILFALGVFFRLAFIVAQPQLSNDYFRFTWDGELQKDGISAFEFLPVNYEPYFDDSPELKTKYKALAEDTMRGYELNAPGMNSKVYYSIYPAVNQLVFYLSCVLGTPNETNLVYMRLFLLLAEVISFFVLRALLLKKNYSPGLSALYWLNPFVIVEILGNLHFDGMAVTFILLSLLYLGRNRISAAGTALALAIHTKLNPLFLLGAAFNKVSFKRFVLLSAITVCLTVLLFATIMDAETFWNFKKSFGLYFAWFSFNAGPYTAIKELGVLISGIDLSSKISIVFPILTMLLFVKISLDSKRSIDHKLLLLYVVYFSFSPVVHPWYLVVLIPLGILSGKLYPILWSFLAFFSYCAYGVEYGEVQWVVYLEYIAVYTLMYAEYKKNVPFIEKTKAALFNRNLT